MTIHPGTGGGGRVTTVERELSDVLITLECYSAVNRSKALTFHSGGSWVVFHSVCSVAGSEFMGGLEGGGT